MSILYHYNNSAESPALNGSVIQDFLSSCSAECETPVRRLAGMLGSTEAAMRRYSSENNGTAGGRHAELLRKLPSQYAAGGKKTPVMLADVMVSRGFPVSFCVGVE